MWLKTFTRFYKSVKFTSGISYLKITLSVPGQEKNEILFHNVIEPVGGNYSRSIVSLAEGQNPLNLRITLN